MLGLSLGMTIGNPTLNTGGGTRLLAVATRGEKAAELLSGTALTSTNAKQRFRNRMYAGAGGIKANTARLVASSYYVVNAAPAELDGFASTVAAAIEYDGVSYPITWGGVSEVAVPAGSAEVVSDAATHPDIPAGALIHIRFAREYAVGDRPIYVTSSSPNPAIAVDFAQRAAPGVDAQLSGTGDFVASGGWTNLSPTNVAPPLALVGEPIVSAPAVAVVGDSITRQTADNWGDGANGAGAYFRRGLNPTSGTKHGFIHLSRSGEDSERFIAYSAKRAAFFKYANVLVIGYGVNDFSRGRTAEATLADLITIANQARAQGVAKIGYVRMAPKSDSSDGWVTTANQTVASGFLAFRSAIDAGVVADGMTLIDVTSAYEEPGMPGIWKANYTTDGVHPTATAHGDAAALLQSAMGSLLA